jgi:protein-S-isoprenylcysteine O-methyltransferase Ste14
LLHSVNIAPFAVLWLSWLAYWIVASRDVKATRRHEPRLSRLLHVALILLAAILLAFHAHRMGWLNERFLRATMIAYWAGLLMLAAGVAVAVWARCTLGRNWSGTVTVKEGHELIRSGPYRFVRHPIYSSLLLAILGTAIAIGEWRALVAFVAIIAAFVIKIRTEERFMRETFAGEYARYRAEVPALIPFIF